MVAIQSYMVSGDETPLLNGLRVMITQSSGLDWKARFPFCLVSSV